MIRLRSCVPVLIFLAGLGLVRPAVAPAADRTIVVEFFSNHL